MVIRAIILALALTHIALAQQLTTVAVKGDRLSGFVLPIVPVKSDLVINGTRAFAWKVDDTRRLVVEGDVRVTVGAYSFATKKVVVWINRIPSADGLISQCALYFPEVGEPSRRAGLGVAGDDVLVTASFRGEVKLKVPLLDDKAAPAQDFAAGDLRLQAYLQKLASAPAKLLTQPDVNQPKVASSDTPMVVGASIPEPPTLAPTATTVSLPQRGALAIFQPGDLVTFAGRETSIDEKTDTIMVTGSALIDLTANDPRLKTGELRLSSERAIVFLKPGSMAQIRQDSGQLDVKAVQGIYLEGDVIATDGNYIMRGQQVYYDIALNRAVAAQAVLRTYVRNGIPVYARANEMRQISADQFEATDARVSISEFFTPHLSVGADKITVTKNPGTDAGTTIDASHVTFRSGNEAQILILAAKMRCETGRIEAQQVPTGEHRAGLKDAGIAANWAAIVKVAHTLAIAIGTKAIERDLVDIIACGEGQTGRRALRLAPVHRRIWEGDSGIGRLRGRRVGALLRTRGQARIGIFDGSSDEALIAAQTGMDTIARTFAVAFELCAILGKGPEPSALVEVQVDDPGNGVRAILGGCTITQNIHRLQGGIGDLVEVGGLEGAAIAGVHHHG